MRRRDASSGVALLTVTSTYHGTASPFDDGSFTYVPNAGFTGTETFTYIENDGTTSSTGTVTITVVPS